MPTISPFQFNLGQFSISKSALPILWFRRLHADTVFFRDREERERINAKEREGKKEENNLRAGGRVPPWILERVDDCAGAVG